MAYSGKKASLHGDVMSGRIATFWSWVRLDLAGFSSILFAKLTIKSSCLSDSERSVVDLILYCVLPEIFGFCCMYARDIKITPDSQSNLYSHTFLRLAFSFSSCWVKDNRGGGSLSACWHELVVRDPIFFELLVPKVQCVSSMLFQYVICLSQPLRNNSPQ